ncbi:hypothetical protein B0H19DRAFT_1234312 [Mycena capillaripes]|nr:hypothetical protein B0H19DRAFT_1234312 [Mycena capillaripes]
MSGRCVARVGIEGWEHGCSYRRSKRVRRREVRHRRWETGRAGPARESGDARRIGEMARPDERAGKMANDDASICTEEGQKEESGEGIWESKREKEGSGKDSALKSHKSDDDPDPWQKGKGRGTLGRKRFGGQDANILASHGRS